MRKIMLLLVIFAFSSVSALSQNVIGEILKRMDAHQKSLQTLQADITTTKFSVQFGGTFTKEGTLTFLPKVNEYYLRIDSTIPAPESFSIIKNQYLLYLPSLKTAYTGKTSDSQKNLLLIFSNLSKKNLKSDYNIRYIGQEKVNDKTPAWKLELTPKTAKNYKTLELWIDATGMPIQSKAIENNDDWTNVMFENIEKNIKINASIFAIQLPKETKIIKN